MWSLGFAVFGCLFVVVVGIASAVGAVGGEDEALSCPDVQSELRFAVIADLDKKTQGEKHWLHTVLKVGHLQVHHVGVEPEDQPKIKFSIEWDREIPLRSRHAHKSRGLELSDLAFWKGTLWSICDSTGILYRLLPSDDDHDQVVGNALEKCTSTYLSSGGLDLVPTLIITDDGGQSTMPAKNEWLAVRDDKLHIGGTFGQKPTTVVHHHFCHRATVRACVRARTIIQNAVLYLFEIDFDSDAHTTCPHAVRLANFHLLNMLLWLIDCALMTLIRSKAMGVSGSTME